MEEKGNDGDREEDRGYAKSGARAAIVSRGEFHSEGSGRGLHDYGVGPWVNSPMARSPWGEMWVGQTAAGPGGPCAPLSPIGPMGPMGPIEPAGPAGPGAPARPLAPGGPRSPAGPAGPASPFVPRMFP